MAADSHLPGILRLDPDIRHRIYLHVGLGQRQLYAGTAPAVYDLGGPSSFELVDPRPEDDDCGPASFHGLLLSCRTIYVEASALLYSKNWFIVRYQPGRSLGSLRALTPHALASLTNLKVVLNQTSCHAQDSGSGECCGRVWAYDDLEQDKSKEGDPKLLQGCFPGHEYRHDPALDGSTPHIMPRKLELSLVCDVRHREVQIAKLVLDGLYLLPPLKDCHLQHIAQEAVLRARGIIASSEPLTSPGPLNSPPRPLNLPREIRLRILDKEVTWHRRWELIPAVPCYNPDGPGFCAPECGRACEFSRCWQTPWPSQPSIGCFCRRRHAAFSSRCKCWAPPTPLFLVCPTLYMEANLVFYSKNRFIVVDSPRSNPWAWWEHNDYPHESFAASQFLRHVVPQHCLGHLRFLELTFSPFTHLARPRDEHPALRDWDRTIDWLQDKLNLRVLTLRLVVAGNPDPGRGPGGSYEMTRDQGKEVLATYNRILLPLQLLGNTATGGGLARFHAVLPWPWKWTRRARNRLGKEGGLDWLESKDRELKRRAEKFVMGDRYESVSVAAVEPQMGVWWWGRPSC
ncbi:hypothetical protein C8A00DRAFT_46960 [Chaetomidium leptoderma]|uniref:Uncharacterized protein n=1 Tax=Chaetomidium leptoderma TaxID=669021 RepID=A0AAN6ZTF2_9PEZI|nr:hypothetical protein C8A00DRAFT_46960 [Chaetomidium leptoderma]